MENQHRKIRGYRELSQPEIDLMNRIKLKGEEMLELCRELGLTLRDQQLAKLAAAGDSEAAAAEWERYMLAEPQRWSSIGKTDIERGVMALVRAVAQPI